MAEHAVNLRLNNLVWHPNNDAIIIADKTNLYLFSTADSQYTLLAQLSFSINSLAAFSSDKGMSLLVSSYNLISEIVKYNIENQRNSLWQQSARAELLPRIKTNTQLVLSTRYNGHRWWKISNGEAKLIDVKFPFNLQFVRYELSDDGKRALFSKHGAIFELNLEKETYQKVLSQAKNSYVVNYDERNNFDVIYSSDYSGQWQLWLYKRATDEHRQLTEKGGYSGRIIGQYLYYSKFAEEGLWRKKLTEKIEERVIKDFSRINWLNWHVINNKLYFYREKTGIWLFDLTTSTAQLLMEKPDNFVHHYWVGPDQKHIFWVKLKSVEGDIYQYNLK